ncbi:MAG: deoxyribodipyrimidine photo-lyase, partial [Myxococcota bacterium]
MPPPTGKRSLHWFRSDLRLGDNTALSSAAAGTAELATLFVFDERLLSAPGRSVPRVRFLLATLERLTAELEKRGQRLLVRTGDPRTEVPAVAAEVGASLVTWNRDYGPYAKSRDAAVARELEARGIESAPHKDRVVFEADEIVTQQGGAFAVYTPYRNAWWRGFERRASRGPTRLRLPPPVPAVRAGRLPTESELRVAGDPTALPKPGEAAALQRLRSFLDRHVGRYEKARDFPALDATSRLSPYLRFG